MPITKVEVGRLYTLTTGESAAVTREWTGKDGGMWVEVFVTPLGQPGGVQSMPRSKFMPMVADDGPAEEPLG